MKRASRTVYHSIKRASRAALQNSLAWSLLYANSKFKWTWRKRRVRWPRRVTTHANMENTYKLTKRLHRFYNTCAANAKTHANSQNTCDLTKHMQTHKAHASISKCVLCKYPQHMQLMRCTANFTTEMFSGDHNHWWTTFGCRSKTTVHEMYV